MAKVLEALPAGNKVILEHLMAFLFEVSTHKTNCMSIPNIAIVFAPNLMRPREERIEAILANSSTVNLIISLLIQHHEVLFHGKEFTDHENAGDPVLTPQLISLKMAQSLHSKSGSSTSVGSNGSAPGGVLGASISGASSTTTSAAANNGQHAHHDEKPPVSPRGGKSTTTDDKKSSSRKNGDKPMKRSQTVSAGSSTSSIDSKSATLDKKKLKREKSANPDGDALSDISVADLDSAALALNLNALTPGGGSPSLTPTNNKSARPKKKRTGGSASNSLRDDIFLDTLKKGTMRLAANLLEEQELVLEMAELEGLTPAEREELQQKLAKKITESKSLRDNSRKQRQVQRSQTNFTRMMDQQKKVDSTSHKRSISTSEERRLIKKSSKRNGTSGSADISAGVSASASTYSTGSAEAPSLPESEVSSIADPEMEMDPAMMQFEDELDRQLSLEEEDNPLAAVSDSESDSADYELLSATLPPPLPLPVLPSAFASADSAPASPLPPVNDEEEERVAEAVMEGDMQQLQEYIGSMKRKKRLDRSLSNKKILNRMSINMSSSSGTLPLHQ